MAKTTLRKLMQAGVNREECNASQADRHLAATLQVGRKHQGVQKKNNEPEPGCFARTEREKG